MKRFERILTPDETKLLKYSRMIYKDYFNHLIEKLDDIKKLQHLQSKVNSVA